MKHCFRFRLTAFCLATLALLAALGALNPATSSAAMKVGVNLDGVGDSSQSWVFVDVFKMSRQWMSKRADGTGNYNTAQAVPQDSNGWATTAPFTAGGAQQIPHTIMPGWLSGTYTVRVTGAGTLRVKGAGSTWTTRTFTGGTNTFTFVNSTAGSSVSLEITQTANNGNHLRDIRVWLPGYASSTATFHPTFKSSLTHFNTFRFMDWGHTNANPQANWADRTLTTHATQARPAGLALEYMIQLANEMDKNLWINIPHAATDSYVFNMASLLRDQVEAGRKIYVEYSNEVWNSDPRFTQYTWVANNISGPNQATKYANRAAAIMDIFYNVFGQNTSRGTPQQRLVRVAAWGRSQNSGFGTILAAQASKFDAIAFNAYFGTTFSPSTVPSPLPSDDQLISNTYSNWPTRQSEYTQVKNYATQYNKRLLTYEGGQHYNGWQGAENNDALTARLQAFNRSWQMRNFYRNTHLNYLSNLGVELHNSFSHCGAWSKWGSWGMMEYQTQVLGTNAGQAGKAWAVKDWIQNNP